MLFPNSSAMDATATGGGPITVLPQIVTGQPEQIAKHVLDLLHKAAELTSLYAELSKAADQLGKVWSGGASESALQKISHSLDQLTKIINVIEKGAELLGVSGTLVKAAQEAYRSVVAAVNPTVASLMSNWWTYGAAVALSTATSATLRGFITAVGGLLKALGAGDLANQITQVATIIGDLEKLFHHGSSDASGAAGNAAISGTPVSAPQLPAPVASTSGQAAIGGSGGGVPGGSPSFTNYTPPALSNGGWPSGSGTGTGAWPSGSGTGAGAWPSGGGTGTGAWPSGGGAGAGANPGNSWIPVDPAPVPSVPGQSIGAHEVVIHTDLATGQSTVEAPAGQDVDIDVDVTYQGKHFQQHVDIDAKGA